jgi:hypothetical protein
MSSHVRIVIVGGFPPEKEAAAKELGGQHSSSTADPNILFEQGKPQCMLILVFRWCEHVEPWTCSRRFLRTPDTVKHLPHHHHLWLLSTSY